MESVAIRNINFARLEDIVHWLSAIKAIPDEINFSINVTGNLGDVQRHATDLIMIDGLVEFEDPAIATMFKLTWGGDI